MDLDSSLSVAVDAATLAGDFLKEKHEEIVKQGVDALNVRTKGTANDYVSDVDGQAQQIIIKRIQQEYPDHRFLAEEEGADDLGDADCPYRWIIDPLDGTIPFIHGKENFGVLIALQKDDETVLGLMYRPMQRELYTAIRGKGAAFNGNPITLRETKDMADAVLCSNLVHRAIPGPDGKLIVTTPLCASLENYGNAVQEFAEVFQGKNDGVFFDGPRLWDVTAGCLIMQEAGGQSRYELKDKDNPRSGVLCVSSTKPIFEELCAFLFS